MPSCKIIIATHKPYWMPDDSCYLPLQVGSAGRDSFGIARDDTGENISLKNPWYCELTGLYWGWKNLDADYIGLVHYRRLFTESGFLLTDTSKKNNILTGDAWVKILQRHPLVLPKKRNYFIENRKDQFIHAHGKPALSYTEEAMKNCCPEYLPAYEKVMARTRGHIFNMFVMRRDLCDAYCTWLFPLLTEIEDRMVCSDGQAPPRMLGFISERLLDVWIEYYKISYAEVDYVNLEPINWPLKIYKFLLRSWMRS